MTTSWKVVQKALADAGFSPGEIDGVPGRMTLEAIKAFQRARGLEPDGIIGSLTRGVLFPTRPGVEAPALIDPPWVALGLHNLGLHERSDNAALRAFLKSDKHTLGDPAKLPWCGDFVQTCIAVTLPDEPLPANPYLARNWQKFGRASEPVYGAVGAFWRGSREGTTDGHVAFIVGHREDHFRVLGGNQSDMISKTWIAKERLLQARIPVTWHETLPSLPHLTDAGEVSVNEA